jgi:hypothetical protein
MTTPFVGWLVGFPVGRSRLPDMNRPNGMNDLAPDCRECRVVVGGEMVPGISDSMFQTRRSSQTLHFFGLE